MASRSQSLGSWTATEASKSSQNGAPDAQLTQPTAQTPMNPNPSPNTNAAPRGPGNAEPTKSTALTALLLVAVLSSMFLVSLDRTIVSTAVPQISDDFNSADDVGWYGSAYLLTFAAFQLLFGKLYTVFPVKGVFLVSVLVFEVASAICGAAPNSIAFIIGRAIAGLGAAGITTGTIVCIVQVVPLKNRPQIQGVFGAVFGIAAIAGPLIGGAFTTNVTWRWCFYLNLPLGGAALLIIVPFLHLANQPTTNLPLMQKLKQLDLVGTLFLVPGVVCLLLALGWGGQTYPWSNGRIIALFVLAGVLLIIFGVVQVKLPATATLPPHVFKQRSVLSALLATTCIGAGNYLFVYFLPIYFQVCKGASAAQSGIRLLAMLLPMVFGSITGGMINTKIGYYTPLGIIGSCVMAVGAGLITTFGPGTGEGKWIGYQVLYGIGLGYCFQIPNLAAQTCLPKKNVPTGIALMIFGQLLGAAVFVAVGENVLGNQLVSRLSSVPGFDSSLVTSGGITSLLNSFPPSSDATVISAYNAALQKVFQVGLIVSCISVLGLASLEWRSVKQKPEAQAAAASTGGVEEKKVKEVAT